MGLFILSETSAGYALFKSSDKKLLKRDDLAKETDSAEGICSLLKLKQFQKFDSATSALEECAALGEGKVSAMLGKLLDSIKDEKKVSLAVADPKLGASISKLYKVDITPIADSSTNEIYRGIRNNLSSLIPDLLPETVSTMSLGLSHSLSRHKLKFSTDKIDTMIIQAVALLDELDKELNTYAMRAKEWYGWHFPEMAKIINDNLAYSKIILKLGFRTNAAVTDLADILPEEIEGAVKAAAEISMGTEITAEDLDVIQALAEQVVEFYEYRQTLASYLSARMQAIAPNLTTLVGDLVGARLIAHAGSLMNLAKSPASTIQILGAEKALFRALKTKHDTPKYGLIYHASLVGQATGKNKGKIARMLATKTALALRVDSLADWGTEGEGQKREPSEEEKISMSVANRLKIERRLRSLEGKALGPRAGVTIGPSGTTQPGKWAVKEARKYNPEADGVSNDAPAAAVTDAGAADVKMSGTTPKLIEEVSGTEDEKPSSSDDDVEESDDDESSEEKKSAPKPASNGTMSKAEKKAAEKEVRYAEKLARRAGRAAKREEKAARKAVQLEVEAKKAAEAIARNNDAVLNGSTKSSSKKRKHEDTDERVEKKSKQDHSGENSKAERKKSKKHKSSS